MTDGIMLAGIEAGGTKIVCAPGPDPLTIIRRTVIPTGRPMDTRQREDSVAEPEKILSQTFAAFPDSYEELRARRLAYFRYACVGPTKRLASPTGSIDELVQLGLVTFHPITYEAFLPVRAAGIFHSNLAGEAMHTSAAFPDREAFEAALDPRHGHSRRDELCCHDAIISRRSFFGAGCAAAEGASSPRGDRPISERGWAGGPRPETQS